MQVSDKKLRIKGNAILLDYLRSDILSSIPNHPALGLLVPNQQGSLAAEEDSTQAMSSRRAEKRKMRSSDEPVSQSGDEQESQSDDEPESYEVEEILSHCRDNQASI